MPPRRPGLPDYDAYQHAFHEAFRPELFAALDALSLPANAAVLDVPCGDGFYTARLAPRCGRLVAADNSPAYLRLAREACPTAEVREADAYNLPFDAEFDVVFCAQSLISLDDPPAALAEFVRVLKPGGRVVVLEGDEYHHVLLPWPVDLELTVLRAVRRISGEKRAPARRVRELLKDVGLEEIARTTFAADRAAPWGAWEDVFLARHLAQLTDTVRQSLPPAEADEVVHRLADPALFGDGAEMTCVNALHVGRKASASGRA